MDPDLEGRSRETVVKILADRMPVPPTRAPFEPVEFEGLKVTPYVTDKGRMAYSLRATGIKPAARQAAQGRRLMPARRVTTVTVPVDVRSVVAFESYTGRTPLLTIMAARPGAAGHPDPARAARGRACAVRPQARRLTRPVRHRSRAGLARPARSLTSPPGVTADGPGQ